MAGSTDTPILSEFAGDPEMATLIREFVETLPTRVLAIQELVKDGSLEQARSLAHQLKGAGGGYGFPQVTIAARAVEMAIRDRRAAEIPLAAERLVALARRVRA